MLDTNYLRHLILDQQVIVGPTIGNRTISGAFDLFNYIDRSFQHWAGLGSSSNPTIESTALLYEVIRDGNFKDFFGEPCCNFGWTESQIIEFCKNNYLLLNHGFATLFPVKGNYFVRVDFDSHSRLGAFAFRSDNNRIWKAQVAPRFVLPPEGILETKVIEP